MAKFLPKAIFASPDGQIFDHPELEMLCRKGNDLLPPNPNELIPLPQNSDLFLLPARHALGFNRQTGRIEQLPDLAVAAFACPGFTLSGLAAYLTQDKACHLPLFAYGAVGYGQGKFWICAQKVDPDPRQQFAHIPQRAIRNGAYNLIKKYPQNRLVKHLSHCALTYGCPAAKNLALGRYEAPLPTARTCTARCIGCISLQDKKSGFPATQERIKFTPSAKEIAQVMLEHNKRAKQPIFSFGQGCEGEPLTEASVIAEAIATFRKLTASGTINVNTNGSLPQAIDLLCQAGADSFRISLNSGHPDLYTAYYRPQGYKFSHLSQGIQLAKANGKFVSLNLLFFPGITDQEDQYSALATFIEQTRADFIQLRNLNLDPEIYLSLARPTANTPAMGLANFKKRLTKEFPWLKFGYFNPSLK